MMKMVTRSVLALCLMLDGISGVARGQEPETLARGIAQVDEGDLEGAVGTLEAAISGLNAAEKANVLLYLGIAHVGLDQLGAAQRSFEEALRIEPDSRLPGQRSPKTQAIFELARQARGLPSTAPATPPASTAAAPTPARRGSRKGVLLLGVGAVAAGGVALAVSSGGSPSTVAPPPSTTPAGTVFPLTALHTLVANQNVAVDLTIVRRGVLTIIADWSDSSKDINIYLNPTPCTVPPTGGFACGNEIGRDEGTREPASMIVAVEPGTYKVTVRYTTPGSGPEAVALTVQFQPS